MYPEHIYVNRSDGFICCVQSIYDIVKQRTSRNINYHERLTSILHRRVESIGRLIEPIAVKGLRSPLTHRAVERGVKGRGLWIPWSCCGPHPQGSHIAHPFYFTS